MPVALLVAALIGAAGGALAVVSWRQIAKRNSVTVRPAPMLSPRIPETLVAELEIAAAALDRSDDIVLVNRAAYSMGVVRGNGTLAPELRRLVRQVRRDGVRRDARVTLPAPDLARRPTPLHVHALSLGGEDVAVIAEDVTEEER